MNGKVTIIKYNENADSIVSAAGRISSTKGGADEIYERSCSNETDTNRNLIRKILSSGHESVLEHIFLNLSFDYVSVFVEQFMIEFRLASFTVKSRRYVDFGTMGYVVPDFSRCIENNQEIDNLYRKHMEYLFEEYNYFVQQEIPKEDARFVLPYSFKSNFYCTVNAREFVKIVNEMLFGRGKEYPELVCLGQSLWDQCEDMLPYLHIKKQQEDTCRTVKNQFTSVHPNAKRASSKELVSVLGGTESPENIICSAAALKYGIADWQDAGVFGEDQQKTIIHDLLQNSRRRELEQVNFTVLFHRISLAGVTHLVRHRMQSILIPNYIEVCDFEEYIVPESIQKAGLEQRYRDVFARSKKMAAKLSEIGFCLTDQVYLLLSGMTIPVMTTMNANELYTFFNLRACNRAQWEIKNCADALLDILRVKYPVLFSQFGPTCYTAGACPEGKMTCGQQEEVCRGYASL